MKNILNKIFGQSNYHFKVQYFKRGESFDHTYHHDIKADDLEQAKQLILKEYPYSADDHIILFDKLPEFTQLTIIEKDIPPSITKN